MPAHLLRTVVTASVVTLLKARPHVLPSQCYLTSIPGVLRNANQSLHETSATDRVPDVPLQLPETMGAEGALDDTSQAPSPPSLATSVADGSPGGEWLSLSPFVSVLINAFSTSYFSAFYNDDNELCC
ncbi:hypothetical protein C8Q73DRAFT_693630 [Cubamyces lactineus]|nr:hypothetical protein C8Q73DRAFT_693630 [Cubamyces lactineus]